MHPRLFDPFRRELVTDAPALRIVDPRTTGKTTTAAGGYQACAGMSNEYNGSVQRTQASQ